jgi:hypothetical protein
MNRHLLLLLVMLLSVDSRVIAQQDFDPIHFYKGKKEFTYGLNNRRTHFLRDPSTIYGLYMGIEYSERLKHVITLNSNLFAREDEVHLYYIGLSEEFLFLQKKKWDFSTYLHAGIGRLRPERSNKNPESWAYPLEAGLHVAWNWKPWLGLKSGGGYRFIFPEHLRLFEGWYYKAGISFNYTAWKDSKSSKAMP